MKKRTVKRWTVFFVLLMMLFILTVSMLNWNILRQPVSDYISKKIGREFNIAGDLEVKFFPLKVSVNQVRLANSPWSTEKNMVAVEKLYFTIKLISLFKERFVFPEVFLFEPRVILEKNENSQVNWVFGDADRPGKFDIPIVEKLIVESGALIFRDPNTKTDLAIKISTLPDSNDQAAVKVNVSGVFKNLKTNIVGVGGRILSLWSNDFPYPLNLNIRMGESHALINGTITGLISLTAADINLHLKGNDLADLFPIIGVSLPPSPPYEIRGQLLHQGKSWEYKKFSGRVGDSDLSGNALIDTVNTRPFLKAVITSKLIDFDDLGGFVGAPPKTGPGETASPKQRSEATRLAKNTQVLPDQEFRFERLNAMDADVKLTASHIKRAKALPIENLTAHLKLDRGHVTLEPLNFGFAGGNIISTIFFDARKNPIAINIDVQFKKLYLNKLFPTVELTKGSVGFIGGYAKLKSDGNSIAQMAAEANGNIGFSMSGGKVSNLLLEVAGIDGGEIIKFLLRGDRSVTVRCAVAQFKVINGTMSTQIFEIDTADTNIAGEGSINLASEDLNLTLRPYPKDKSILAARTPLRVTGTFKQPSFRPDMAVLAAKGGSAVMLGTLLGPMGALLPLIEIGPGKDSDCRELLELIRKNSRADNLASFH